MDREQRIALVTRLCEKADCNEKVRKIHFHQFVDHNWHPHPPADFVTWWKTHPESKTTTAAKAFNCAFYLEQFQGTTLV